MSILSKYVRMALLICVALGVMPRAPAENPGRPPNKTARQGPHERVLFLRCWTEGRDFHIQATLGDFNKERVLREKAKPIRARFDAILNILDNKTQNQLSEFNEALQSLGEWLIAPFSDQLEQCESVRFQVNEKLIRCAFDLLPYEGRPLFLQRPVCYQVSDGDWEDEPEIALNSAYVVADLTADPEEACRTVSGLIPNARYALMENSSLKAIQKESAEVDAVIVSAHGETDRNNSGCVYINEDELDSDLIEEFSAGLVYFDSCQQGVNMDFLQAFQEESDTQFYLAPIISNDAGDSSTKTMIWFFEETLKDGNPVQALFETRKRLYEFYAAKKSLNPLARLNKSFAFRIYEFVGGDEE